MGTVLSRLRHRLRAVGLPKQTEAEKYGSAGEDRIYRILSKEFDCVVRNIVLPVDGKYLEKDFFVFHHGVPFVLEIKNWKGTIYQDGDDFCQDKSDGTHRVLRNPAFSTADFIDDMERFYQIDGVVGMVVFADEDCELDLPDEIEGIRVIPLQRMLSLMRAEIRRRESTPLAFSPNRLLRCTRIYSRRSEFCKGLVSDRELRCRTVAGEDVYLNLSQVRYMKIRHQPLLLRDKLEVIFTNGTPGVFYQFDNRITVCCLDGSCRKFSLSRLQYILF